MNFKTKHKVLETINPSLIFLKMQRFMLLGFSKGNPKALAQIPLNKIIMNLDMERDYLLFRVSSI